ncbi:DUF6191 domain-containing protein [Spongisporangium articulatum]|uniref:DUF6191 domain-containing protein n=1 Tax=Spongisporangium articulatum TaxID=3362603 RepID=A0ABW8AH45_9ACTN
MGLLRWMRGGRTESALGGGAFGEAFEVFQPTRKHTVEQQDHQKVKVAPSEDGAPPLRIDLESGRAVVRRPRPEPPSGEEAS